MKIASIPALAFMLAAQTATIHAQQPTNIPVLWNVHIVAEYIDSSPALATDGTIYTTCWHGQLQALYPDGRTKWQFDTGSDIKASPALGDDGTIYFGGRDRRFHALRPDGRVKWLFSAGAWIDSSAAIATNGVVYFGCWDNKFYALDPDGTKRWTFTTGGPIDSSPAIARDGTVYFGSHDKNFYALDANGAKKWAFATGGQIISSPALAAGGVIYFTSTDGQFHALNPDGSEKWHLWIGGYNGSSPVIDAAGDIYIGAGEARASIRSDGVKKWAYGTDPATGSPAVAADGLIYFPLGQTLYGFNAAGSIQCYAGLDSGNLGPPVISPQGVIYVGGGRFCALEAHAALAASPWPVFRGNLSQNGRAN